MAFTYDLTTDAGLVRAMVPDNQEATYLFDDAEIEAFLAIEGHIKRATALALETIASNEAMVLKVIRTLDIQTDGAKVSDALLKRASVLRGQVKEEEAAADAPSFEIAELVVDTFTWRDRLYKQNLRGDV